MFWRNIVQKNDITNIDYNFEDLSIKRCWTRKKTILYFDLTNKIETTCWKSTKMQDINDNFEKSWSNWRTINIFVESFSISILKLWISSIDWDLLLMSYAIQHLLWWNFWVSLLNHRIIRYQNSYSWASSKSCECRCCCSLCRALDVVTWSKRSRYIWWIQKSKKE